MFFYVLGLLIAWISAIVAIVVLAVVFVAAIEHYTGEKVFKLLFGIGLEEKKDGE